jgi:NADH-quinone oxidoreductase subunit D
VDRIVPVDIYLPGCPPRPEMLIDAIVKLDDKIQNMKLGVNRARQITELEQAGLRRLPLVASVQQLADHPQAAPPPAAGPPAGRAPGGVTRRRRAAAGSEAELPVSASPGPGAADSDYRVVNMGPQHPSTHGVLRLVLTLDGETVKELRPVIGYLHTGIEKNTEYRTWTQGVTFVTRADYLMPLFNETAYCLAVERLLGIEDRIPDRASVIRVLLMELNRISSHLGGIGPFGLELGATTVFTNGTRTREKVLDVLELITGLRMNHAFIRPGGVALDIPAGALEMIREFLKVMPGQLDEIRALFDASPLFQARTKGLAYLDETGCMALGVTGPMLRSTGLPWDLRKSQPYCGYDTYEFDVPVTKTCDAYGRYRVRMDEMDQSLRIIEQCVDRLAARRPADDPVMISDAKIGWPARLALGPDGLGNSPDHIAHIMSQSMEALIHHFKLVTEGFEVPAGQVYAAVESPRGELGCHLVSDGGTRPYRVHLRDPSFSHLQALPAITEGGLLADVIAAIASMDPILGGVDR